MAKTNQRTSAAFTGTINLLSNGQNLLLANSSNIIYKPAALSLAQLEKINAGNRFTQAFTSKGFFNKSFPAYENCSGYNRLTSAILNQAITGNYPHMYLDHSKVLVSKGNLPGALHAGAAAMNDGNIYFSFTDNSDTENASSSDKIILVAYIEELNKIVFDMNAGKRSDCESVLQTSIFKGFIAHTWIGFLSNDETNAADSVYTESVQL